MRYRKGHRVVMTNEALENYGEQYRGKVFVITHTANKYMPSKQFFAAGKPEGYHPGYAGSGREGLYDLELDGESVAFSLYDWELALQGWAK